MKSEFQYPTLTSREPVGSWQEAGKPNLREKARKQAREIFAATKPLVSKEIEDKIAARLPIHRIHDET